MTLRFGTDGVRGPADELTPAFVTALGRAAARVLGGDRFVIGRDTRESGPAIEASLRAGIEAEGGVVEVLGVVPTPAVACLAAAEGVPGAMISASHNPYRDNGVKFFAAGGSKLRDAVERELERAVELLLTDPAGPTDPSDPSDPSGPTGPAGSGTAGAPPPGSGVADLARVAMYEESVVASLEGRRLDPVRVVLDCANGAASTVAAEVLRGLGAEVVVLHGEPDGRNINEGCGSTHPADLQRVVVERGAHAGLAFDGDADRVLAVDERGNLVDGDHIIAMCAIDLRARGRLAHDTVVVTVMTNLGFRLAMAEHAIDVVETQVGDRYVLEELEAGGYSLGGEQSGHVIFRELATTGDGLLTGVQLLDLMVRAGRPLSALAAGAMTQLPQVLHNVRVARRDPDIASHIAADIAAVEAELGREGRVLVRPSGTEPLVRVMVEATDGPRAEAAAQRLVAAVQASAGSA